MAGSAVGSTAKPVPTGELLKGVAPEATHLCGSSQIERMTEQRIYRSKAVEDEVEAKTLSMSFGVSMGQKLIPIR